MSEVLTYQWPPDDVAVEVEQAVERVAVVLKQRRDYAEKLGDRIPRSSPGLTAWPETPPVAADITPEDYLSWREASNAARQPDLRTISSPVEGSQQRSKGMKAVHRRIQTAITCCFIAGRDSFATTGAIHIALDTHDDVRVLIKSGRVIELPDGEAPALEPPPHTVGPPTRNAIERFASKLGHAETADLLNIVGNYILSRKHLKRADINPASEEAIPYLNQRRTNAIRATTKAEAAVLEAFPLLYRDRILIMMHMRRHYKDLQLPPPRCGRFA